MVDKETELMNLMNHFSRESLNWVEEESTKFKRLYCLWWILDRKYRELEGLYNSELINERKEV